MFSHSLGEALQQIAVRGRRLLEGVHYLAVSHLFQRDDVVQIVGQCLLQHVPLRLPLRLAVATSSFQSLASMAGAIFLVGMLAPLNSI
jgi:hypothetical protein